MLDAGHDGTHGRSGEAIVSIAVLIGIIKLIDAISVIRGEHEVLSCRVEIPSIGDLSASDITARRQRGTSVPFPNDPQNEGRSCGRVVHLYDPRFVLLHANRGIMPNHDFLPIFMWVFRIPVCGEPTRRRKSGVELDENGLDGRPSLVTSHVGYYE